MKFPNTELFLIEYKKNLIKSHSDNPNDYAWPISELDNVFKRMRDAIIKGSFNKDSKAFKLTCKALKIKHTYRDIEIFLKSEV
jgi:hypothetical protein